MTTRNDLLGHFDADATLLDRTGLVEQSDRAQVRGGEDGQVLGDVGPQVASGCGVVPEVIFEELLEGANRRSGGQGDGLGGLAG